MRICQDHWDRLRKAIDDRGLGHLGAKTGADAVRAAVTELEGRGAENDFDPLMTCNNMITATAIEHMGIGLLGEKPGGGDYCPICEKAKSVEEDWIHGPAESVLKLAREKGLVR